jgi:hypothetical protein
VNVFQALSDARLNPFGMQLLAESLLKSAIAEQLHARGEPLRFYFPISRGDCAGWAGVNVTLMPVKVGDAVEAEFPDLTARAFEIADQAMFEALHSYGVPRDESGTEFGLARQYPETGLVAKLADAGEELRESVDWLQRRGCVEIRTGSDGKEFVAVLRNPEDGL